MPMAGSTWPDYLAGMIVLQASGLARGAAPSMSVFVRLPRRPHFPIRHLLTGQPRGKRDAEGRRPRASWRNVALCSAPRAPPANKLGYSGRKFAGIGEHHEISCLIRFAADALEGQRAAGAVERQLN
jgi:hypothetical protein